MTLGSLWGALGEGWVVPDNGDAQTSCRAADLRSDVPETTLVVPSCRDSNEAQYLLDKQFATSLSVFYGPRKEGLGLGFGYAKHYLSMGRGRRLEVY